MMRYKKLGGKSMPIGNIKNISLFIVDNNLEHIKILSNILTENTDKEIDLDVKKTINILCNGNNFPSIIFFDVKTPEINITTNPQEGEDSISIMNICFREYKKKNL